MINKYGCESLLIPSIKENRQLYFGIAIILVILYHTWCKTPLLVLAPFQKGSIGVDIFLFLSGFGLSCSYIKNSTARFYLNRLYRIYPIFIVFATYRSLIYIYEGDYLSAWDWICNLTTLSYYQIGGRIFDWYVAAIIILYLSFPLLFRISRWQIVISVAFLITAAFWILGRPYFIYECLISRIPIFMAGIVAYRDSRHLWIVVLGFILCSPLAIFGVKSSPLGTCMIVFIIIIAISVILNHKILPPPFRNLFLYAENIHLSYF